MDASKAVTATFTQDAYTLSLATVGSGLAVKEPDLVTYGYGTVVTLTATADPLWSFAGWSGDVISTTNPLVVTMDGSKDVVASFCQYRVYVPVVLRSY
jgi:hypothetical protein